MRCNIIRRKDLILTKEERETIETLVDIFREDDSIGVSDIWDIMSGIANEDCSLAEEYGYNIIVTDM